MLNKNNFKVSDPNIQINAENISNSNYIMQQYSNNVHKRNVLLNGVHKRDDKEEYYHITYQDLVGH